MMKILKTKLLGCPKAIFNFKLSGRCLLLLVFILPIFALSAEHRRSDSIELENAWDLLDSARQYRNGWRNEGSKKTHSELIHGYKENTTYCAGIEVHECFLEAADLFRSVMNSSGNAILQQEAKWGLQEAHNEYMAGQSLVANDLLIRGLRVRFPGTGDPDDPDQLSLLSYSEDAFQKGIDSIVADLRTKPEVMRVQGDNPQFPFFVENSLELNAEGGQGEVVENELYRFTHLVQRRGIAANSKGKRMFFFGNVKDVDNFPYRNFPAPEDIDLNGDGIRNEAGRLEASAQFKKSAHATYLHGIVLSAIQSEDEFYDNDGYTLKRQVTDAERMFDDIKHGFNPLRLQGDFVPFQPVENFLTLARTRIEDAVRSEDLAKNAQRSYDQDESQLREALLSQKQSYDDRLQSLTGLDPKSYDLTTERERLITDAHANAELGNGQLGIQKLVIKDVLLAVDISIQRLNAIPVQIMIEQQRHGEYARLVTENGQKLSALTLAEAIASCCVVSIFGPEINPYAAISGGFAARQNVLQATQQADIDGIQSAATIKQLLLESATLYLAVQEAKVSYEREVAQYEELTAELDRLIDNHQQSNFNMASAYFNNPAYRIDRDQLVEAADTSFETAMVESYYASKALEYFWSEKFNNPVLRLGGGLPESLSASFDAYIRAESVFSVAFADDKSPNLDDFLDGLQAWDVKMRQFRVPAMQQGTVQLSLKKDILNFNSGDNELDNLLFKNFISEHRVSGQNSNNSDLELEFNLGITDESLFPDHPNIKIANININLVSDSRSIRDGLGAEPILVDLAQLDKATVRSFFAEYPNDDDLLIYELEEGRSLEKSPFSATVEATVDNYAYPQPIANTQLAGHSPAINRWVLRIKMNRNANQDLKLENLSDIEISMAYSFGKPREITF